jgi:hypothetical protein
MKKRDLAAILICFSQATSSVWAQPAGLRALCQARSGAAALEGSQARRFQRHCFQSPLARIVFADPECQRVAQATLQSESASAGLAGLSAAQRRAGEDCRFERMMLEINDAMLSLIDRSPSHCGHSAAGLELMRASQSAMKRMSC